MENQNNQKSDITKAIDYLLEKRNAVVLDYIEYLNDSEHRKRVISKCRKHIDKYNKQILLLKRLSICIKIFENNENSTGQLKIPFTD